jgi:tetratricopeptide (TPR) repeat protein
LPGSFGNPLGLEGTVSEGIISAVRNDLGLIQISAPISPGSSGSPVITEEGRVIGVATLQSKIGENLNFAIPVERVNATVVAIDQRKPVASLTEGSTSANQAPEVSLARKLLAAHKFGDAVGVLKEYLAKNPKDAEAWIVYAETFRGEEAADAAQRAVDLEPESLDHWRVLIYCLAMVRNDNNPVLLSRLKQAAEHDLAAGDDFNMAYYALIQGYERQGDKEQAAKLRQEYEQLIQSGELADYTFGKEERYFDEQIMFPADQVAKELDMELTDEVFFVCLKSKGHSFTVSKESCLVLVDGVAMNYDSRPARYKHQRYFLDAGLVELVLECLLSPKEIVQPLFLPEFRIENVYLGANLPVQASEEERVATQKLIDAALKFDPRLFKYKTKAAIPGNALVINLHCGENNDAETDYVFSSRLGNRWSGQIMDFAAALEFTRGRLANLLQIRFAQLIRVDSPQSKVITSTTFQSPPNPTRNPTLIVEVSMSKSAIASNDAYLRIARWLEDATIKVRSDISGAD